MEKHSALDRLIWDVPDRILEQSCSDDHLREIGICITNWQTIAPHLNLSPANEEDIAAYPGDKRIRMLRRWQEKYGSGATYRSLADSFQKSERADLIDKIRALLTAPKWLLPSSTSTLSPYGVYREQPLAAIPLRQASQSPIVTLPYSHSQPIPVPVQHHEAFLSTLESQTIYPTSDLLQVSFGDLTSQLETVTVQRPNRRNSEPAEEGACGSVSPPPKEEYLSKSPTDIGFTGTSPYEEWCCHLYKNDGGSQDLTASGVVVKLNYSPEELHTHLPGLKPVKLYPEKYGSVQTRYILITYHRVIPGHQSAYVKGWNLDVGPGRPKLKLQGLVCGAVSCCGENGFISSGPNKPINETAVFFPHLNRSCCLDLDFTILFLNSAFEKTVLSKKGVQTRLPEVKLDLLKAEKYQQLHLFRREAHKVVPISLSILRVPPQDSSALKDEICAHKTLQVIDYKQSDSKLTQCCSGSPLASCELASAETLVGIHVHVNVKPGSDYDGSGITIYGIFQLLKGQLAAFFALMEQRHARRKQSFRWDHLLIPALVGQEEKPLSYLLEILHHLLIEMSGICIIELRVSDPAIKQESVLKLLSALFKLFDKHECKEIAEAVSRTFTDKPTENEFSKELEQLSKFLVHLLQYFLETHDKVDLVKAYFVCYKQILKFEYKGKIQAVLSTDVVTKQLKALRKTYSSLDKECVIERNFHDISLQLIECKYKLQISKLNAQIDQLKAQNEHLKAQLQERNDT